MYSFGFSVALKPERVNSKVASDQMSISCGVVPTCVPAVNLSESHRLYVAALIAWSVVYAEPRLVMFTSPLQ